MAVQFFAGSQTTMQIARGLSRKGLVDVLATLFITSVWNQSAELQVATGQFIAGKLLHKDFIKCWDSAAKEKNLETLSWRNVEVTQCVLERINNETKIIADKKNNPYGGVLVKLQQTSCPIKPGGRDCIETPRVCTKESREQNVQTLSDQIYDRVTSKKEGFWASFYEWCRYWCPCVASKMTLLKEIEKTSNRDVNKIMDFFKKLYKAEFGVEFTLLAPDVQCKILERLQLTHPSLTIKYWENNPKKLFSAQLHNLVAGKAAEEKAAEEKAAAEGAEASRAVEVRIDGGSKNLFSTPSEKGCSPIPFEKVERCYPPYDLEGEIPPEWEMVPPLTPLPPELKRVSPEFSKKGFFPNPRAVKLRDDLECLSDGSDSEID